MWDLIGCSEQRERISAECDCPLNKAATRHQPIHQSWKRFLEPGRMGLFAHGPLSAVPVRAGRKALAHQAAGMSPAIVPEDGTRSRRLHWRCGTANPPGTHNPPAASRPPTHQGRAETAGHRDLPTPLPRMRTWGTRARSTRAEESVCMHWLFLCVPCSIYTMMTVTHSRSYDHHRQCIPVCILLYLSKEDY